VNPRCVGFRKLVPTLAVKPFGFESTGKGY
jgi:hypothetical protein